MDVATSGILCLVVMKAIIVTVSPQIEKSPVWSKNDLDIYSLSERILYGPVQNKTVTFMFLRTIGWMIAGIMARHHHHPLQHYYCRGPCR